MVNSVEALYGVEMALLAMYIYLFPPEEPQMGNYVMVVCHVRFHGSFPRFPAVLDAPFPTCVSRLLDTHAVESILFIFLLHPWFECSMN